ncbi:MAG: hypothetical protein A2201_11650 [Alicyclobacillus sp. RIFOXYA1_FULL_53_8]|nr:MAG: hypothetical protein A2201_11650 [Alicyclobacillus sp. RIFOXYA1_FULL_53_8]
MYRYLKTSILSGRLVPGEKLVETKLAASLQISRSPVREAMRMLTVEQLLVVENGTVSVFTPTLDDFRQVYELRVAIESKACETAAMHFDVAHQAAFDKNLAETAIAVRQGNADRLIELNSEFHALILQISGNLRFQKIMFDVSTLIHFYWRWVLAVNSLQTNILAEHEAVYEALVSGDGSLAARQMTQHIQKDLRVIESAYLDREREGKIHA